MYGNSFGQPQVRSEQRHLGSLLKLLNLFCLYYLTLLGADYHYPRKLASFIYSKRPKKMASPPSCYHDDLLVL
jgi:hypothetical protein